VRRDSSNAAVAQQCAVCGYTLSARVVGAAGSHDAIAGRCTFFLSVDTHVFF